MLDRVPTYPGRVSLIPVLGSTILYDMEMADEATQDGTPLNKESLLTDDTCSLLRIPTTSTPNDALLALRSELKSDVADARDDAESDFSSLADPKLIIGFKSAGAYTWTVPYNVTKILVAMIGAGGGGYSFNKRTSHRSFSNGNSGCLDVFTMNVSPGTSYPLVIGAGVVASDGGSTSGFGRVVYGGAKYATSNIYGDYWDSSYIRCGIGSQQGRPILLDEYTIPSEMVYYGCVPIAGHVDSDSQLNVKYQMKMNTLRSYLSIENLPFMPVATASVYPEANTGFPALDDGTNVITVGGGVLPNGNTSSTYRAIYYDGNPGSEPVFSVTGTDPGCGGASCCAATNYTGEMSACAGGDGGIFVYNLTGRN